MEPAETDYTRLLQMAGAESIGMTHWPRSDDRQRWVELLSEIDLEALVEEFMGAVRQVPAYEDPLLPLSEIRRVAWSSFGSLLGALRGEDVQELFALAQEVGASRARAKVPMASLMTAIRLDFAMIWNRIVQASRGQDAELLLRHSMLVWHLVDAYARSTQDAYLEESRQQSDLVALARRALVTELLQTPAPSRERRRSLAVELGVDPAAVLTVASAQGAAVSALSSVVSQLQRLGCAVFTHFRGSELLAFVPWEGQLRGVQDQAHALVAQTEVGLVQGVAGVEELPAAADLAGELGALAQPGVGRALTPERDWARVLRRQLEERGLQVSREVAQALAGCGVAERTSLETAVRAYLDCGNVTDAAARSFCHRNTLTNRLRRFQALTGIDVMVPQQAARLVVSWA